MRLTRIAGALLVAAAPFLIGLSGQAAFAGPTPSMSPAKKPSVKPATVSVLYSATARRGTLAPVKGSHLVYQLTLQGATGVMTWFTDRPERNSGFVPTRGFVKGWVAHGFAESPPNVALAVRTRSGATDTVVAEMTRPKLKGDVLSARLRVLTVEEAQRINGHLKSHAAKHDEDVPGHFNNAALFIDDATGQVIRGCLIGVYASCPGADLTYYDLSGTDMTGMDLAGANLSYTNLSKANMTGVNLTGANVIDATLSGANLTGANFKDATVTSNFELTNMTNADFTGADGHSAFMGSATLNNANFTGANFAGASFKNSHLNGASLVGANLQGAVFFFSMAENADFDGADLTDGTLYETDLNGASLRKANLTRVNLAGSVFDQTDFTGANLTGASVDWNWILRGAITDASTTCPDTTAGPCKTPPAWTGS